MLKNAIALALIAALSACADSPQDFLEKRGRPGPISCIRQGEDNKVCTDGAGVTWLCENRLVGADSQCVILSSGLNITPEHK